MARGRHRKPPAWRRLLTSLLARRHDARTAALHAEIRSLQDSLAQLQRELADARLAALSMPVRVLSIPLVTADTAEKPVETSAEKSAMLTRVA